jgi:pimeloyl-ACP methyl ester carboxylesterase
MNAQSFNEQSFAFGPGNGLIGTVCLPVGTPRAAVVLFNAGVIHRIGPHRLNVRLARRLAAEGIASIRFDLAGLGDSARPAGDKSFEEQAVADVRAAMDALGARCGLTTFTLFGFCSGAYHSYAAAQADDRVSGLVLFDAYRYRTFRAKLNRYRARIQQHGLINAVAGRITRMLARLTAKREAGDEEPLPSVAYITQVPDRTEFAAGLNKLLARGTRVCLIFSGGFEGYNYAEQFDDAFRGLLPPGKVGSRYFPGMDHVATRLSGQEDLMKVVMEWALPRE